MKQLRCSPGDLALIVGLNLNTEQNGQVCEVLRSADGYLDPVLNIELDWIVQYGTRRGRIQDVNLIPLRGNPDATTETRTDTKVPVTHQKKRAEV